MGDAVSAHMPVRDRPTGTRFSPPHNSWSEACQLVRTVLHCLESNMRKFVLIALAGYLWKKYQNRNSAAVPAAPRQGY